ncbi:hypothetical protein BK718_15680 [Bacillus thuringiensis serovar andalousiensis]|uniref:hypothetical protein n=1 Tax=Bacillus cereus group TaxID=86661 RepID=UPI0006AC306B|nr:MULTISPECIES: hypothetical protein [Bacillus cereus group]MDA2127881.1 hypothetical protein [Bacillus cereus]MEB8551249.1 hypothetical protein [Bacillus cereus]MEB8727612.1 hypothetical protein [Bacillus cereus]OTX34658.1 hypothetical protein BK718_15680 [Bacillus thuringiensis serovar andalousiensis]
MENKNENKVKETVDQPEVEKKPGDNHTHIREIQMQVHLKSGRAVMLYEDITEFEKEQGVTITEEMIYKEMKDDETDMADTIHGMTGSGNVVSIPRDSIDYVELNIVQRLRDY